MSDAFLGTLQTFAFEFAPKGWMQCNGALLQRSQYTGLSALLGTLWGGDGFRTVGIPDARGRIMVGVGASTVSQDHYAMGEYGGVENVILKEPNMPAHAHGLMATPAPADLWDGNNRKVLGKSNSLNEIGEEQTVQIYAPKDDKMKPMDCIAVAGGGLIPILQPGLTTSLCICVDGPVAPRAT